MDNFEGRVVAARRNVSYVIRSDRAGSQGLLTDVQHAVAASNASLPVANVRTLQEIYDGSLARTSFALVMLAAAGAMALLIGLVGLYGAMSYLVAQRTREIGIRMALGARRGRVAVSFVAHGCLLATGGVLMGLAVAVPAARALRALLADVSTVDLPTYAVVSVLLMVTAAAASSVPALRASGVDPVRVLRTG
jgi:ABC-type antimicrobial peptide transport system permease subunit